MTQLFNTLFDDRSVNTDSAAYAGTLLRVSLGIMFLAHSVYLKMMIFTLGGTAQFFESLGLPGFSAYLVFAVEAIAGILLIVGYKVRFVSLATVPVLLGATWAHLGNGWLFSAQGGGWEFPLFLVAAVLVQAGLGSGAYALDNAKSEPQAEPVEA